MRFCYYKLINDLCGSLNEAAGYIAASGDASLLPVCIEAVDTIESTLAANPDSVHSEKIGAILSKLKAELTAAGENTDFEAMLSMLAELSEECRENITYRLKVLFVTDIGGKWDAMAGAYYAFAARSDCDTDIVIEPVFRNNTGPDGVSRTETIFEDYLTPMGIKHIPYEEYDIEKTAPDITFISQPYESTTLPKFWPENIAKYSRLVYLPYYNQIYLKQDGTAAEHPIFKLTVQKVAWKIVCQSEKLKDYYKMYGSEEGRNVIVTGTPKCDYPQTLNKDNTPCPNKWKKPLSGKKVFLWNSHYILDEQGINIIEQGLDFIRIFAGRKDVALIWRAHPLTEMVLKLYQPDKLPAYKKLIKTISESDNIIIDKNATYDCSFVWSDAMISDSYSSLADQYLMLDKPIIHMSSGNAIQTKIRYSNAGDLHDFTKWYWGYSLEDARRFVDEIVKGIDKDADNRRYLLDTFYTLADGHSGERIADYLCKAIYEETVGSADQ